MMTTTDLDSFYQKRIESFESSLTTIRKKINRISNGRLLTAAVFLVLLYLAFNNPWYSVLLLPVLLLFIILLKKHSRCFEIKVHLENLCRVNQIELQTLSGVFGELQSGHEFIDAQHPYSHDLDIFGEGSLYQALNRCHTVHGKKSMAERLSKPLATRAAIEEQQEAIKELGERTDLRQHVQAAGKEINEQASDHTELLKWLHHKPFVYGSSVFKYVLFIFPILTLSAIAGAWFVPLLKPVAIILALVQWTILGFQLKKVNAFHEYISRKKYILEKYAHILRYLQEEKFSSPVLANMAAHAHQASTKINDLAELVSALNARQNAMTNLVVNSLLLYDLQCVYRLEKWKDQNIQTLPTWLNMISELEVLCSMGTFSFNHPHFVYPTIHESIQIESVNLGHPLLQPNECVPNTITIGGTQSILIITGANMAGKSTFLRTVGVNMVLALSGAPVCATNFACPVIQMRSGMRTADSLKDHQSYFYAELNRLKSIIDELQNNKPLLILLDEILKGTNSTDKQAGSTALVKQLRHYTCLTLLATHDLALGELAQEHPDYIKNFCFEANIENDQLSFDYKLKPGLAQKMNATFLMKKMGIIPA